MTDLQILLIGIACMLVLAGYLWLVERVRG
jgi:hypothetical protein